MTDPDERWALAGTYLVDQMREQAMSQAELVRASGVSDVTVRRLMNGEPGRYRDLTLAKVAKAVGWTTDSFQRILDGSIPMRAGVITAGRGNEILYLDSPTLGDYIFDRMFQEALLQTDGDHDAALLIVEEALGGVLKVIHEKKVTRDAHERLRAAREGDDPGESEPTRRRRFEPEPDDSE